VSGSVLGAALAAVGFGDFAAFGSVSFMLLGSPETLSRMRRSNYAKLPLLGARPVLQWTYDDLEQITMGIRLDVTWCDPDGAVALLDQARTAHQPQPLVFGAGQLEGQFVITQLVAIDRWRYSGVAQHIDARLTLSEWQPTLPTGAPTVQPSAPAAGIIGVPGGFAAIYAAGSNIGQPVPTNDFLNVATSAMTRAGAL
jgi:phage protein U